MKEAVIVACGRSAIGRAPKGTLKFTRPEDIAAQVLTGTLKKVPGAEKVIEDVILGCAMPEGEQGSNLAKLVAAKARLPKEVPAQTVNRFCSSGLQTIAIAANSIMAGQSSAAMAGGVESMSMIPMGGARYVPDPELIESSPENYMAMGLTAERVAEKYNVSRQAQDEFACASHQKAAAALKSDVFKEQIIPLQALDATGQRTLCFQTDEGVRPNTTMESLSKLRPVFKNGGSVTAGNASQTSDGASFVVIMEKEKAIAMGYKPLARFLSFAAVGVEPELMGIGPIKAIPKALQLAGLTLSQIDLIELNEAFAAQAIACIDTLNIDPAITNVNGGAIALGHPLGCTGAALTTKLIYELSARQKQFGLVSMCIGGGQGAAGIFELL